MKKNTRRLLMGAAGMIGAVATVVTAVPAATRRRRQIFYRAVITDLRDARAFYAGRMNALAHPDESGANLSDRLAEAIQGTSVDAGGYACDIEFARPDGTPENQLVVTISGRPDTLAMLAEMLRTDASHLTLRNIAAPVSSGLAGSDMELTFFMAAVDYHHRTAATLRNRLSATA